MKNLKLRKLLREEIRKTLLKEGLESEFKPTKKQQDIMDLIAEMTENKKTGMIKYLFSVVGDSVARPYGDWSPQLWEKVDKFFTAYAKTIKEEEAPKEKDQKMKEVKIKKK
jgi:hypothetical protein